MKRKIIVIGGSKGIGNAIIDTLLPTFDCINISRSTPEDLTNKITHYNCDVTIHELPDIEDADHLIYCPGSINLKPISRLSVEDFQEDFNINVLGAVKAIKKYLPILKKGNHPSILLFSTVAVKLGMPFHASIATAKAGIEGLTKSLAAELAPTIRVNAIAPTVTNTSLASKLLRNEKSMEQMKERHPLKKYLEPEEVASMASFLISENATSITGQIFEMDCGLVNVKV